HLCDCSTTIEHEKTWIILFFAKPLIPSWFHPAPVLPVAGASQIPGRVKLVRGWSFRLPVRSCHSLHRSQISNDLGGMQANPFGP
ncbi:MAG TPA: hypothetical protein VHY59_05395, partial [Chthoniobacterales bacterium]|nr:hypothetical protein [Chthoniobacterales bacterium]